MKSIRFAIPIFTLAVIVFFGALIMAAVIAPPQNSYMSYMYRQYALSSQEADKVRKVVFDKTLDDKVDPVLLTWSNKPGLEMFTVEQESSGPMMELELKGQTLYIHTKEQPKDPHLDPLQNKSFPLDVILRMPLSIKKIEGSSLSIGSSIEQSGSMQNLTPAFKEQGITITGNAQGLTPSELELTGFNISVSSERWSRSVIESLHVIGLNRECLENNSQTVSIDSEYVHAIDVQTMGPELKLSRISKATSVIVKSAQDLEVSLDRIWDIKKIKWIPLSLNEIEKIQALSSCTKTDSSPKGKSCKYRPIP